jgi:hypothetical protein
MSRTPFIPRKDIEFHRLVNNFINCLSEKQKQFHFPEEAFEELEALQADFNAKFAISKDPNTRTPYTFPFEYDQRGQTVYFALRWENTRGEKGPWSEIHSTIIP